METDIQVSKFINFIYESQTKRNQFLNSEAIFVPYQLV